MRKIVRFEKLREFLKLETSGGLLLWGAAVLALIVDNSPFQSIYESTIHLRISIQFGPLALTKPLLSWINDGLMTLFFLLMGLEIKRELMEGELEALSAAFLPAFAALGGMLVPILVYVMFNAGNSTALRGWAAPSATDVAFSLGILALLGKRVPVSLKVFLTTLAIFDDIGAIIIIAIFYVNKLSYILMIWSLALVTLLVFLNRFKVQLLFPYVIIGIVLWICVLQSGVHATLTGILLAFVLPSQNSLRLERKLHPVISYGVLPLFAFANAGVSFSGSIADQLFNPVTLGITLGLFIGKQIGIFGFSWISIKSGWALMPRQANFRGIYGIAIISGIGFTMSLFIGNLAFGNAGDHYAEMLRMGVIAGSLLSALCGYFLLRGEFSK